MADLLKNEKTVVSLPKFLKTTGIGKREGANERELEWARKQNQEGENLLE